MTAERMTGWRGVHRERRVAPDHRVNPRWDDIASYLRNGGTVEVDGISLQAARSALLRRGVLVSCRTEAGKVIVWMRESGE